MDRIYVIGDMDTVSAFRLAGVTGVVSSGDRAPAQFEEIVGKSDAAVVIVTNELAGHLRERIREINLNRVLPVIVEIPGVDDREGFRKSDVAYIAEALGIAL